LALLLTPRSQQLAEAVQAKLGTLSLEAQNKLEADTAKKEAKAEAKADAALKKKLVRQLLIHPSLLRPSLTSWRGRHPKLVLRFSAVVEDSFSATI
jgi:hypothetical protein